MTYQTIHILSVLFFEMCQLISLIVQTECDTIYRIVLVQWSSKSTKPRLFPIHPHDHSYSCRQTSLHNINWTSLYKMVFMHKLQYHEKDQCSVEHLHLVPECCPSSVAELAPKFCPAHAILIFKMEGHGIQGSWLCILWVQAICLQGRCIEGFRQCHDYTKSPAIVEM